MKKTKFLYIVIAILFVMQMNSTVKIRNLKAEVQRTKNSISNMEERLNGDIRSIYSNVDKKLAEQASIVSFCNYEVGEFNFESRKVPITFRVQPKTLTKTTEVSLRFDQDMVLMERGDTAFVLTKEFPMSDEILPTIIVENDGIQQFENNDYLNVYDMKDKVFPSLYPRFHGESGYNHEEPYRYYLQGEIDLKFNSDTQNRFRNIKYIVTIDDEVIKTYENDSFNSETIEVDDTFELKEGQILIGKVVVTSDLNYTQEYIITQYVGGEKKPPLGYKENEKIIAPDGTVIYEFNENEF
ncbi:hypothetical protein [Anaerotignum sp.]|uniref:hypothetical protein n=1 Tax=Anaerotignum sp. TaxID=2039241 RepID=UPI0027145F1A|nr:hypothetical protein [Anaerotignum sp.]